MRLLALLLLAPTLAAAQTAPRSAPLPLKHAPRPTVSAVTPADLMTRLYVFADDSMAGREVGTAGHARAVDYIARELARMGAEPAGDNGTFFQDFPLGRTVLAEGTRLTVEGTSYTHGRDFLIWPELEQLGPIGGRFRSEGVEVVFGGTLGSGQLIAPEAAAGKLVLFAPAAGPNGWQFWATLNFPRYASAAGIIVAALETVPDPVRGILTASQMSLGMDSRGTIPIMYVTRPVAEAMFGGPLTGVLAGTAGKSITAVGGYTKAPTEFPARNVVAIVRGTDPVLRNQYIAFSAHPDHDGLAAERVDHDSLRAFNTIVRPLGAEDAGKVATPAQLDSVNTLLAALRAQGTPRVDSVMNGADDDGSGSMGLLEMAEYFRANPTRRSMLFVWVTAEEKGLLGSQYYGENPTVPRDSIIANINVDMIGRGDASDLSEGGPGYIQVIGSRRLSTELGDLIEEVNQRGNHGFVFDYQYDANGHPSQFYCRSDHYNFARWGIPVAFLSTGSHLDYHMATDEPQYINYDKFSRVVNLLVDVGRTLGERPTRPVVDKPKPDPHAPCQQ